MRRFEFVASGMAAGGLLLALTAAMASAPAAGSDPFFAAASAASSTNDPNPLSARGPDSWQTLASEFVNTPDRTGSYGDYLGSGIGVVGDHMIAVAAFDRINNAGQGTLHTYQRVGGQWQFSGRLPATTDGSAGGMSPRLTDRSGDRMILGSASGVFMIVRQQGDGWIYEAIDPAAQFSGNRLVGVSIDGSRVAVAHPSANEVRVLQWSGTQWTVARVIALPAAPNASPQSFDAIDLHGDRLIVGRWGEPSSGGASLVGKALVYRELAGEWQLETALDYAGAGVLPRFGFSVSINADTIAVAAPSDDVGARTDVGSVSLFRLIAGTWTHASTVTPANASANAGFGTRVLLRDGRLYAASYPMGSFAGVTDGGVHEYSLDVGQPVLVNHLFETGTGERMGLGFDVQGNDLIVGVPLRQQKGGVKTFTRQLDQSFAQQQLIEQPFALDAAEFGSNVAINADHLLVHESNAPRGGGGYESVVRAFERDGDQWQPIQSLRPAVATPTTSFGAVMTVHGDLAFIASQTYHFVSNITIEAYRFEGGQWTHVDSIDVTTIIVGFDSIGALNLAPGDGYVVLSIRGLATWSANAQPQQVQVVDVDASGEFGAVHSLFDPESGPLNAFGSSIAVDGDRIAVFEPYAFVTETQVTGATIVFDRIDGNWIAAPPIPNRVAIPFAEDGPDSVRPEGSLALYGERLVVAHDGGVDKHGVEVLPSIDSLRLDSNDDFEFRDHVDAHGSIVQVTRSAHTLAAYIGNDITLYDLRHALSTQSPQSLTVPAYFATSFSIGGGMIAAGATWNPEFPGVYMGEVFVHETISLFADGFE